MARADLLLDLVKAGAIGDQLRFRNALEALVAEERAKGHDVLADRLATNLNRVTPAKHSGLPRAPEQDDLFTEKNPARALSDLVLPPAVRDSCKDLIEEQVRREVLNAYNLEPRHRVLLVGPPGNGKTSLAEAIAGEMLVPLLAVRYEALIASYLGETALRVARLFEVVRRRRCVLFLDEFDVLGKERGDVHETGEIKRVVSSLLLQVDGLPSHVVVISATNHPELLDRAVWRRFQLRLELPNPTPAQVIEWLEQLQQRMEMPLGVLPREIARKLTGVSFGELEQFGLDVQRRYVLSQPGSDLPRVVRMCLQRWSHRFTLKTAKRRLTDA